MEPAIPQIMAGSRTQVVEMIPDAAAYEKKLPPFAEVVAKSDKKSFEKYGLLTQAYLFAGNKKKAESLYAQLKANSKAVLGPKSSYAALVEGNMALVYFFEKNYSRAEPLLLEAIKHLEKHVDGDSTNILITNYMCMAIIRDNGGKTAEAQTYAKKLVDLAVKQETEADSKEIVDKDK
jgi:tetratricopeptide (TPR) repeat protein